MSVVYLGYRQGSWTFMSRSPAPPRCAASLRGPRKVLERSSKGPRCGTGRTHEGVEQRLRGGFHLQTRAPETPGLRTSGIRVAQGEDVGSLKNWRQPTCWEGQALFSPEIRPTVPANSVTAVCRGHYGSVPRDPSPPRLSCRVAASGRYSWLRCSNQAGHRRLATRVSRRPPRCMDRQAPL